MSQSELPEGSVLEVIEDLGEGTLIRFVAYRDGDEWWVTGWDCGLEWKDLNLSAPLRTVTVLRNGRTVPESVRSRH